MRRYRLFTMALLALGMWSCADFQEENVNTSADGRYEEVLISLTSTKGQSVAIDETRVHVGNVSGSNVTHYWDEGDKVGIFTLNSTATASNHEANIDVIMENKNRATFSGMIQTSSNITDYDLFVYYPYNGSLLDGESSGSASTMLKNGLTFRLQNEQLQSTYSTTLDDYDHPSRYAVSHNGFAYDLVDCKGTVGTFELNHANTYLQFNVIGKQTQNGDGTVGTDFANGKHRLTHLIVEAGTYSNGEFSNPAAIAGNYRFSYDYSEANFEDKPENINIKLDGAGATAVKTTLQSPADGTGVPALNDTTRVPVFSVINTSQFAEKGVNCLKVTATCGEYNENGAMVKVNTRIRYYNIAPIIEAGGMQGGDYYAINFEMSDPVETYTHLDAEGHSNCYIIPAPGFYTFNVDIAGNGKYPGKDTNTENQDFTTEELGFDPAKLIKSDKFKLDWLWASGTSFDAVKNSGVTKDVDIVKTIVKSIALSGTDGIMQLELAESASSLSGNILVALYEDTNDNDKCDDDETITWSWHLWLGTPVAQHYKFENTDTEEELNNTDWYMFDRNLGAESNELGNARSAGLYYQAGRKDPFIGYASQTGEGEWTSNRLATYLNTETFPNTDVSKGLPSHATWTTSSNGLTFNVANVRNYPMSMFGANDKAEVFTYGWVQGINSSLNNSKTFFDPCPPGYKLPTTREWDNLKNNKYFNANRSITKTGVFGYCPYIDANFAGTDIADTMKMWIAGGDYYEVNNAGERTYHIYKNSGNGQALTTTFPNTGYLKATGEYVALTGTASSTKVNIVGAPQLSSVSGTATTTTTTLASPTVQAEAITDGESTVVTETKTVTISSASRQGNSYNGRYFRITLSAALPDGVTLYWSTNSNGTGRELATKYNNSTTQYNLGSNGDYVTPTYVWISADNGQTFSSSYATISYSSGSASVTNGTLSVTTSTGTAAALTGYRVEMSRLAGLSYYWTTNSTFATTNALTTTKFELETNDTDIYIWAYDGTNSAYTRLQYSNGTVTATKQNAANVVETNISNYKVTISNYDATKEYYWTTTPYFAETNEIEDLSGEVTIQTSSEQIYIWAYNPNLDVNSAPTMAYYANKRFAFTNGTPATDSEKDEITNNGGNFMLWSTGRINNGNKFEHMWFGVGTVSECGLEWSSSNSEVSLNWGSTRPYTLDTKSTLILYSPNGAGHANDLASEAPAAAVRCIREYNID